MKKVTCLLLFSVCISLGMAQPVERVKDINHYGKSTPYYLTPLGNVLYFVASDSTHGDELWRTDGTDAGTSMVKDISPGSFGNVSGLTAFNGKIYFNSTSDLINNGFELWVSDGTAAGTTLFDEISPGNGNGNPLDITACYSQLFFSANDGIHGQELWVSDGTVANTHMVKDITPGANQSTIDHLLPFNNKLYFICNSQLWCSDGTLGGTFNLSTATLQYDMPLISNNKLFYSASDATHGYELWSSDGTTSGTTMVKDVYPGSGSAWGGPKAAYNGRVYFIANDATHGYELWSTDGTDAGTSMLKDINPGQGGTYFGGFQVLNNKLYFGDSIPGVSAAQLWVTDGTEAGTVLVKNISTSHGGAPYAMQVYNGRMYFYAVDSAHGREIWQSDGTDAGTYIIAPAYAPNYSPLDLGIYTSCPMAVCNGLLFYPANYDSTDVELYKVFTFNAGLAGPDHVGPLQATLSPNPAIDNLNLSISLQTASDVHVRMFDVTSKDISEWHFDKLAKGSNDLHLKLPTGLRSGNYFIKVAATGQANTLRLTIK